MSTLVFVFGHWGSMDTPYLIGQLRSTLVKNTEHFSFTYDKTWLQSSFIKQIDPDLMLYSGEQHNTENKNFGVFLDSCPDRWGRLLMKRREIIFAKIENRKPNTLFEIDFLLGVHDQYRMGGIRFSKNLDGPFLDDNQQFIAPPISSIFELEQAKTNIEEDNSNDEEYLKWISMLISPGSSLGGARPKCCVVDENKELWIAKFPSKLDEYDVGLWEFVTYKLALNAGVNMAPSLVKRFGKNHHTFLTKRFDRVGQKRIYFSSALTQLGYYDGEYESSYLEIAQFLINHGSDAQSDLAQLFRRIVFNIAISNTDDHLRNHGFLLSNKGWLLSPAYDLNPTVSAKGLHLNITDHDNSLDFNLALEVAEFFRLNSTTAQKIIAEVKLAVKEWKNISKECGLSRNEIDRMATAFNF